MKDIAKNAIRWIDNGEDVDQEVTNRPLEDLVDYTNLMNRIDRSATVNMDFRNNEYKQYELPNGIVKKQLTDIMDTVRSTTGSVVTPYGIATVAENLPRLTFNPETGEAEGLLCEEQRTNLLLWSEDFSQASMWDLLGLDVVSNSSMVTPSAETGGYEVIQNSASTNHRIRVFTATSYTEGQIYTQSTYLKFKGKRYVGLWMFSTRFGVNQISVFDLVDGTIFRTEGGTTATITDVGNGWYKCTNTSIPCTSAGSSGSDSIVFYDDSGISHIYNADNDTDGVYAWGAQLEEASFSTSYIKTETSQVTRVREDHLVQLVETVQLSEFTLIMEVDQLNHPSIGRFAGIGSGSANRLDLRYNGVTIFNVDGSSNVSINLQIDNSERHIIAVKYDGVNLIGFKDGVLLDTISTDGGLFTLDSIYIGRGVFIADNVTGLYKRMQLIPHALSDAELSELTKL